MKAIILAGGKGTRFLPLTETIPKALIPIDGKTLIEHTIDSLPDSIDTVIITTKYLGHMIEEKFGASYAGKQINYAAQPHSQNGTWSALYCAQGHIDTDEPFLVLNCDDLFDKTEIEVLCTLSTVGMGVTKRTMPAKYHGIAIQHGIVTGFNRHINTAYEAPIEDLFANGLYILDRTVFDFEPVALIDGELGLPHTLLTQKDLYPLQALTLNFWQPCNTPADLEKIKTAL